MSASHQKAIKFGCHFHSKSDRLASAFERNSSTSLALFKALISIVCFALFSNHQVNAFDQPLVEEFLAKAPAAWENFGTKGFAYRAEYSTTSTESANGATMQRKYLCKEQQGHRLLEEVPLADDPKTIVSAHGFNSDYYFTVQKRNASKDWLLTGLQLRGPEDKPMSEDYQNTVERGLHHMLLLIGPTRAPELIKESTFKILGAQPVRVGDSPCIRIEFDNAHPLKTKARSPVQSGWFIVDPSQSWCVRDYQVKTKHSNADSIHWVEKLEIRPSRFSGFPLPVEIIKSVKAVATEPEHQGSESVRRSTSTYKIDDTTPVSLAEFRLPAYNLPEPEGLGQTYLWYHAAWITALVVVLMFLFLACRRNYANA